MGQHRWSLLMIPLDASPHFFSFLKFEKWKMAIFSCAATLYTTLCVFLFFFVWVSMFEKNFSISSWIKVSQIWNRDWQYLNHKNSFGCREQPFLSQLDLLAESSLLIRKALLFRFMMLCTKFRFRMFYKKNVFYFKEISKSSRTSWMQNLK